MDLSILLIIPLIILIGFITLLVNGIKDKEAFNLVMLIISIALFLRLLSLIMFNVMNIYYDSKLEPPTDTLNTSINYTAEDIFSWENNIEWFYLSDNTEFDPLTENYPLRSSNGVYGSRNIENIIIHHTGTYNHITIDSDWHRSLYESAPVLAYDFWISETGVVYYGSGLSFNGYHTAGHNTHNIGIALQGDFVNNTPTDEQYIALARLIINLYHGDNDRHCYLYDTSIHLDNLVRDINTIKGHKDYGNTTCPGNFDFNALRFYYNWFAQFLEV